MILIFAAQMPVEALVDFTGGFPEVYVGPNYKALKGLGTDLFEEMQHAMKRPGVMVNTCSLIHKYRCNQIASTWKREPEYVLPWSASQSCAGTWGLQEATPTQCWGWQEGRREGSCLASSRSGTPGATPLSGG